MPMRNWHDSQHSACLQRKPNGMSISSARRPITFHLHTSTPLRFPLLFYVLFLLVPFFSLSFTFFSFRFLFFFFGGRKRGRARVGVCMCVCLEVQLSSPAIARKRFRFRNDGDASALSFNWARTVPKPLT